MRRLVVAGFWIVAWSGSAFADPTRKVQIETEPPNATVYIGDTDSGPKCTKTPCTIDAPIGQPTIIIRLDKYEPLVEVLDVPKGRTKLTEHYKLRSAIGTIVVNQPKGASVSIDGEDAGKVPVKTDVSADGHMVTITLNGKTYFNDAVDVGVGDEEEIGPSTQGWDGSGAASAGGGGGSGDQTAGGGDGGGSDTGSGGGSDTGGGDTGISGSTTPPPREHFLDVALAFDVGFRNFSYDMPVTPNLKPESEQGQVILGPAVEYFPMRMLKMRRLRGLSLFARAEFGVHGQQLTGGMIQGTVTTFWASYEASVRHRWNIGTGFAVEASGGYVRDQMQFNASNGADIQLVPDVTYDSLRLGGKLVLVSGQFDVYFSGENRIVLSGGNLATRFDSAKATGLRGALGATYNLGSLFVRAEAALMHYSWTFQYDNVNDMEQADGATDSVKLISLLAGYRY